MKWSDRAVTAFVGPYGSGKTEVAINYALLRRQTAEAVAIVDLDVVTPYFRTREVRGELEELGLRVVAPGGPISVSDLPIIPAEAGGVMENESTVVVVDVGGDPAGARAFGSLAGRVRADRLNVLFVVNTNRPFARTVDSIVAYVREIEAAAGRACDALVSNTHLGLHTTMDMVWEGRSVTAKAARRLGIPIAFTCVPASLVKTGRPGVLPLRFFMRTPWSGVNR